MHAVGYKHCWMELDENVVTALAKCHWGIVWEYYGQISYLPLLLRRDILSVGTLFTASDLMQSPVG